MDEAEAVARECPRGIIAVLHARGLYAHGTSAKYPGKVLCFHHEYGRPDDWAETEAQKRLTRAAAEAGGREGVVRPDTDRPWTFEEMAKTLDATTRPVEDEAGTPLTADPDDGG